MAIYAISDLHLSFGNNKPMDIFGVNWENHTEKIKTDWLKKVKNDDLVLLPGDFSWAMYLQDTYQDFEYLHNLPGKKLLLKGNHDYWWTTKRKMETYFEENGFKSLNILHNNHFQYESYGICGTRGWVNMPDEPADAKVLARETQRLEVSIQSAVNAGLEPIVFMHYPPIFGGSFNYDILDVLYRYKIKRCYYGHIHDKGHSVGIKGTYDDIFFSMISGDYLQFIPEKVV